MLDIDAPCDGSITAVHDSGRRTPKDIRYVVIHCTEGPTAVGAALWFANKRSGGSANLVVDDDACYRTLPDLKVPWAAPPLNTSGFHIEIAGHASWSREEWMEHAWSLRRAAYKAAHRCHVYNIPVRRVGRLGLRLRRPGITGHVDVSKAFGKSDHTDPGPAFPWGYFMALVQRYHANINVLGVGGGKASRL